MMKDDKDLIGTKIYDENGIAVGIVKDICGASISVEATDSFKQRLKENSNVAFSIRASTSDARGLFINETTGMKPGPIYKMPITPIASFKQADGLIFTESGFENFLKSKQVAESERYLIEVFGVNNIPLRFMNYINSPIEETKKRVELFNFLIDIGEKLNNFVSFDINDSDSVIHMYPNEGNINYNFTKEDAFKISEVFKKIGEFLEKYNIQKENDENE